MVLREEICLHKIHNFTSFAVQYLALIWCGARSLRVKEDRAEATPPLSKPADVSGCALPLHDEHSVPKLLVALKEQFTFLRSAINALLWQMFQ